MTLLMILQLMIVLGALWVGSRYGSLALGAISGIGLATDRCYLHHHSCRDLCGHYAGIRRYGLVDTDSRAPFA